MQENTINMHLTCDFAKALILDVEKLTDPHVTSPFPAVSRTLEYIKSIMDAPVTYCKLLLSLKYKSPPANIL